MCMCSYPYESTLKYEILKMMLQTWFPSLNLTIIKPNLTFFCFIWNKFSSAPLLISIQSQHRSEQSQLNRSLKSQNQLNRSLKSQNQLANILNFLRILLKQRLGSAPKLFMSNNKYINCVFISSSRHRNNMIWRYEPFVNRLPCHHVYI